MTTKKLDTHLSREVNLILHAVSNIHTFNDYYTVNRTDVETHEKVFVDLEYLRVKLSTDSLQLENQ